MNPKVLIADDDDGVLALVEATLGNVGGVETYTAKDGVQALEIARRVQPNVMFLDVVMPKKNGFEVCQELKRHPFTANIKVVLLTGLVPDPDGHRAIGEAEADDYITKPFSPVSLLRKFEEIMSTVWRVTQRPVAFSWLGCQSAAPGPSWRRI